MRYIIQFRNWYTMNVWTYAREVATEAEGKRIIAELSSFDNRNGYGNEWRLFDKQQ